VAPPDGLPSRPLATAQEPTHETRSAKPVR
jgi:hypothetical protein